MKSLVIFLTTAFSCLIIFSSNSFAETYSNDCNGANRYLNSAFMNLSKGFQEGQESRLCTLIAKFGSRFSDWDKFRGPFFKLVGPKLQELTHSAPLLHIFSLPKISLDENEAGFTADDKRAADYLADRYTSQIGHDYDSYYGLKGAGITDLMFFYALYYLSMEPEHRLISDSDLARLSAIGERANTSLHKYEFDNVSLFAYGFAAAGYRHRGERSKEREVLSTIHSLPHNKRDNFGGPLKGVAAEPIYNTKEIVLACSLVAAVVVLSFKLLV